jgi:hypothetical protein
MLGILRNEHHILRKAEAQRNHLLDPLAQTPRVALPRRKDIGQQITALTTEA